MKPNQKTMYIVGGVIAAVLIIAIVLLLALGGSSRKYEKHYEAAQSAFLSKDYDKALKELDKAMEIDSTEESYLLLADIYYAQGDTDKAIQVLYLGYSHTGSDAISRMLDELKSDQAPAQSGSSEKPTGVTIGSETFAHDATNAVLSGKRLGNNDIQALSALTSLEELSLSDNAISDISPLSELSRLTSLQLSNNQISNLAPLSNLYLLKTLYIDGNPIADFSVLEKLTALRTLSMKDIRITDTELAALQKALPNCKIYCDEPTKDIPEITLGGRTFRTDVAELNLGGLGITDISDLAECTELRNLDLRDNKISDLSPLSELTGLEQLCLWNNQVTDLSPLLGMCDLRYLDVDTNKVSDILVLSQLPKLEELWLNNNELTCIEPLRGLTNLTRLGLKNVGLNDEDLEILAGLNALKELTIEENEGLTQEAFDALQEALPKCKIAHSELIAAEEEPEEPEQPDEPDKPEEPAQQPVVPDAAYVSVGANAAVNAAGTGTGYAILSLSTDAVSAGIREGFAAQAKTLGMNVVADLAYADLKTDAEELAVGLRALGADVVIVAAGDDVLSALLAGAKSIGYQPQFIQVY